MITCTFENGNQNSLRHTTVDCLLIQDGKILLGKRSEGLLEAGKWGLLGDYMERDETSAQAGKREILEESGWEASDMQLLRVNDNPNRPHEDRQNVSLVYIAAAVRKTGGHDTEMRELRWFPLDDLPPADQIAFDFADNIELYKKYLKKPFAIPVVS